MFIYDLNLCKIRGFLWDLCMMNFYIASSNWSLQFKYLSVSIPSSLLPPPPFFLFLCQVLCMPFYEVLQDRSSFYVFNCLSLQVCRLVDEESDGLCHIGKVPDCNDKSKRKANQKASRADAKAKGRISKEERLRLNEEKKQQREVGIRKQCRLYFSVVLFRH